MKKSILVLTFILTLLGCSNKNNSDGNLSGKIGFKEITDVYLDQYIDEEKPEQSILRIRKGNQEGEVLYTFATKTNFSKAVKLGDNIYVSAYDSSKNDGNFTLWQIDLVKGVLRDTGIWLFDDFEFSDDGQWICYVFNDHATELPLYPGSKVYFPVIYLEKLDGSKKYRFDTITEMTDWPTFAEIKTKENSFIVEYYQDSPTPLRVGSINILNHDFKWLK